MDFLLDQNNFIILAVAIVSGGMLLFGSVRKGGGTHYVSSHEAVQLANRERGVFIDIRNAEQFMAGTIPQARNIPNGDIDQQAAALPKQKDRPIIVLCDAGQKSNAIVNKLRQQGFERAVSLKGGLRSWVQDGLPLAKKDK